VADASTRMRRVLVARAVLRGEVSAQRRAGVSGDELLILSARDVLASVNK
jgi:co-chaperonin GroES (HSP10)